MFGLFKKKTEKEKMLEEHSKLLKEAHRLSTTNRAESDKMAAKADELDKKIAAMN